MQQLGVKSAVGALGWKVAMHVDEEVKVKVGYMPCMGKQEKGREQGPSGLLLLEADQFSSPLRVSCGQLAKLQFSLFCLGKG